MGNGMSRDQRRAMLSEEVGDGDGEVIETPPPHPPPPPPKPEERGEPGPPTPSPAAAPELAQLIAALVAGIQQGNAGTAQAIKDALGHATTMARSPIPENQFSPGKSVYSHPDGDLMTPRTVLRCPMYLGVVDDEGKVDPAFEIYGESCSEWERVQLNALKPGVYPGIERNDGIRATWRVTQKSDDNGQPIRLVIAVPPTWLAQDQQQQMPSQKNFLRQLNAEPEVAHA